MAFHVFIEKAADASPEGRARLAAAIAARFKLPEAQIAQYLQAGRFRVKSNVDEATARQFAGDLVQLGAVVSVEDTATGARLPLAVASPTPAPRVAATPGASAPAVAPGGQRFESGLAAAFAAPASAPTNLGALDDMAGISLASLDGGADESFSGPVGLSAAAPAPGAAGAKLPTSAFMAPDAEGDMPLDLVDDPRATPAKPFTPPPLQIDPHAAPAPRAAAPRPLPATRLDEPLDLASPPPRPRPAAAAASSEGFERTSLAGMQATATPTPRPVVHAPPPIEGGPLARYFVEKPRARLLAGASLALLLGFVAANVYASGAEEEKYGKIRNDLMVVQNAATTPSAWEALDAPDGARPLAMKSMERARSRVRANASVLWALVSGGLAFVWFRKLT